MQRSGQIIFCILHRSHYAFLFSAQLTVRTDFGIEMDIHFIFIKDQMLCAAFVQCFVDCRHLFIYMRVMHTQSWRALRHTSPADDNQRRTVSLPDSDWLHFLSGDLPTTHPSHLIKGGRHGLNFGSVRFRRLETICVQPEPYFPD